MIFEELNFQFDVEKLRAHVVEKVLPLPPHMVGKFFGGWSVTSSTGSYLDGSAVIAVIARSRRSPTGR